MERGRSEHCVCPNWLTIAAVLRQRCSVVSPGCTVSEGLPFTDKRISMFDERGQSQPKTATFTDMSGNQVAANDRHSRTIRGTGVRWNIPHEDVSDAALISRLAWRGEQICLQTLPAVTTRLNTSCIFDRLLRSSVPFGASAGGDSQRLQQRRPVWGSSSIVDGKLHQHGSAA